MKNMPFDRMLDYCADLRDHNERAWFHENHRRYEEARADFLRLLDQRLLLLPAGHELPVLKLHRQDNHPKNAQQQC